MRWSLVVRLNLHLPLNHPAHPAYSGTENAATARAQRLPNRTGTARPSATPLKRRASEAESFARKLRSGTSLKKSPSPTRSPTPEIQLPPSLKASMLAKRTEWVAANKAGDEAADRIELNAGSDPYSIDVATMARKLTCLIQEHLVDHEIRNWINPDFTTTTDNVIAVASMTMMATMQEYFAYNARTGCGFPSVTLLGQKDDWTKMRQRLNQLPKYGNQPAQWAELLIPVFDRFVATFERPDDEELKTLWLSIYHAERGGSGDPNTFSGWMTAFAFWQSNGSRNWCLDPRLARGLQAETLKPRLSLDGRMYPVIEQNSIPTGVVQVPVLVKDIQRGIKSYTQMVAGSVGMSIARGEENGTTVQPTSGWWMLLVRQET